MRKIHNLSIGNVNLISTFISACLGALLILHSLNVSAAEYLDGIAAVVEDDIILESELAREVASIAANLRSSNVQLPPEKVFYKQVMYNNLGVLNQFLIH